MFKVFKLGLRAKLIGMVLSVLLAFLVGGYGVYRIYNELKTTSMSSSEAVRTLAVLKDIQNFFADANLLGMDIIVDRSENLSSRKVPRENEVAEFYQSFQKEKVRWSETLGAAGTSMVGPALQDLDKLFAAIQTLVDAIKRGETNSAVYEKADEDIDGAKTSGVEKLTNLQVATSTSFNQSQEHLSELFSVMLYTIAAVFSICTAMLVFGGLPIIYSVSKSIEQLNSQLSHVTNSVQGTSSQLGSISHSLAETSTQSAAAIQESVSAMTEMGAMLAQTARNSHSTADLSKQVLDKAQIGVRTMEEMSLSMKSISSSSIRLKEIVKIIDDISLKTNVINDVVFKTQLLAVNASIEAARAGQHGKGFAVVANEVASLASMSGKASNEIRDLLRGSFVKVEEIISGTSESVKAGEAVSAKTSSSFIEIAQAINQIATKIEEISAASKEQEIGVAQTTSALSEMNVATGTANTMAQKNAAVGRSLKEQAVQLVDIGKKLARIVSGSETSPASSISEDKNGDATSLRGKANERGNSIVNYSTTAAKRIHEHHGNDVDGNDSPKKESVVAMASKLRSDVEGAGNIKKVS